jgi:polar amino acid transport system ATP-binding protein
MTEQKNHHAPAIAVRGLDKKYGDKPVLRDVSFDVAEGSVTVIVGRSGSGKSTLLRCLNGLEPINAGSVVLRGEPIGYKLDGRLRQLSSRDQTRQRQQFGFVFQSFNLFSNMTAIENVMVGPLRVARRPKAVARGDAMELLRRVGLADRCDAYPARLSGGQQQRVAIARALAMKPSVLLMDEPTSALDPEMVAEVEAVIKSVIAEGMTMVVVTHQIGFAADIATHAIYLDHGEIVEQGKPESLFSTPKSERTQQFLSHVSPSGVLVAKDDIAGGLNPRGSRENKLSQVESLGKE